MVVLTSSSSSSVCAAAVPTTTTPTTTTTTTPPTTKTKTNKDDDDDNLNFIKKLKDNNNNNNVNNIDVYVDDVQIDDFMSLEEPHPYGVLPGGNQLFGFGKQGSSSSSSSSNHYLPSSDGGLLVDESIWIENIMTYLDAISLANLIQTSKYFYISGHQPELWRDLVLLRKQQVDIIDIDIDTTKTKTKTNTKITSWKDLYVWMFHNNKYHHHIPINNNNNMKHNNKIIYSDYLYRNHICRSFAIPTKWLLQQQQQQQDDDDHSHYYSATVPSIRYDSINNNNNTSSSLSENNFFFNNYEKQNKPLIIRDAAKSTIAYQQWSDPEYLLQISSTSSTSTSNSNSNLSNSTSNHSNQNNEKEKEEEEEESAATATASITTTTTTTKNTTTTEEEEEEEEEPATTTTTTTTTKTFFRATSGAAPLPCQFTLQSYLNYCTKFDYFEESPLYLFDRNVFLKKQKKQQTTTSSSQWSKDFFQQFYSNCPYWNVNLTYHNGHDLLQYLDDDDDDTNDDTKDTTTGISGSSGNNKRPDHTWLIMGPKRSGSVFHIDPNATHAWNVSLKGRKRWIFYPPGCTPPGVHPSVDGDEVALPLSVGEWIIQYWSDHVERKSDPTIPVSDRPMECTTMPGDAIFVPHGWWHMVVNLDEGYNVAVTHNYVSLSNLGNVLKFFQEKQDQISGCRDRIESIKPNQLYDEFIKVLKDKVPHFVTDDVIQQSSTTRNGGYWTCRAFERRDVEEEEEEQELENKNKKKQKKRRPKKRKFDDDTARTSSNDCCCGDDDGGDDNNNNNNNTTTESPTNNNNNNNNSCSIMAKANTSKAPFSFSFL